jgi:hypothetical protein
MIRGHCLKKLFGKQVMYKKAKVFTICRSKSRVVAMNILSLENELLVRDGARIKYKLMGFMVYF